MTEARARGLVGGLALVITALIAALIWGKTAVDVVFCVAFLGFLWDRNVLLDRLDEALDAADEASRGLEDVKNHLFGIEPDSTGKHTRRAA